MPLEDLLLRLATFPRSDARDAYLNFVGSAGDAALRREGGAEHITGSCFVFSPALDQVLLCFHRKGRFWVQFGGHVEPQDSSIADTALREAREESGITTLQLLSEAIADLDRHALHGGFACAAHWDVGFVATADPNTAITVSDESDDVRWFPVDALPDQLPSGFTGRLHIVRRAAMRQTRSN